MRGSTPLWLEKACHDWSGDKFTALIEVEMSSHCLDGMCRLAIQKPSGRAGSRQGPAGNTIAVRGNFSEEGLNLAHRPC